VPISSNLFPDIENIPVKLFIYLIEPGFMPLVFYELFGRFVAGMLF